MQPAHPTLLTSALLVLCAVSPAQAWRLVGPDPVPRILHAMEFDFASGRLLTAGGQMSYYLDARATALRVGTRWQESPDRSLPPLSGFGLAADPSRARVVLYGGADRSGIASRDTWEWDGTNWTRIAGTGPQLWGQAVLGWHGGTQRVVLYGAGPAATLTTETWEWDGTNWRQRTDVLDAGRRLNHAMCYDVVRDRLVLFGGRLDFLTPLGDTWEYDGATWRQVQPLASPPPQAEVAMAYDLPRTRCLLLGTGTWEYDGTTWVERMPANSPAPLRYHAMAYDPTIARVVVHGGGRDTIHGVDVRNATWEWDGTDWIHDGSSRGPGKRNECVVATDPATGRAMLCGGFANIALFGDTWRLDADQWRQLPAAAPQPMTRESRIAGDPARQEVLAFPAGNAGARTWTWQNGAWTQRVPAVEPPARVAHAMAADPERSVVVLFGGFDPATRRSLADTWEWNGVTWIARTGPAPRPRSEHAMATDPAGGGVLLFGGFGTSSLLGDTWRLDARGWRLLAARGPSPRFQCAMSADSVRRRVVLVGGLDGTGSPSDHWEWDGSAWARRREPLPVGTTWYLADSRRGAVLVMDGLAYELLPERATATMAAGGGCAGTSGIPRLEAGGLPTLGATRFEVALDRASAFSAVILLADTAPLPSQVACALGLTAPVPMRIGTTTPFGTALWNVPVPDVPALRGLHLHLQGVVLDPAGGFLAAASLSNVLTLVVDD